MGEASEPNSIALELLLAGIHRNLELRHLLGEGEELGIMEVDISLHTGEPLIVRGHHDLQLQNSAQQKVLSLSTGCIQGD